MKKIILLLLLLSNNIFAVDDLPPIVSTQSSVTNINNSNKNNGKYNYFFDNEKLGNVINKIAKQNGLQVLFGEYLSPQSMQHTVSGRFSFSSLDTLFDRLSNQYGFAWFIYSDTLYITSQKYISKSIGIAPEDMPNIKENLQQMGLFNSKFGFTQLSAENRVVISGPAAYVNLLIDQIKSLDVMPTNQQFAVFRLKYASANDILLNFNNQQITIPGVATILQGILQNGQVNPSSKIDSQVSEPVKNQINNLLGKSDSSSPQPSTSTTGNGSVTTPLIEADSRLNTIIIRDKANNLKIYKNLIDLLDVPSPLIQVEVLIVHLDQEKISQAGINWWASGLGASVGYGTANLSNPSNNLSVSYGQVNPGQLLVTNMAKFVSSLQFLEANNLAQAVGKPSMVTTDNLPAIMNINENLYLSPSSAGNSINNNNQNNNYNFNGVQITQALQITPHVIYKAGKNEIKLSIALQDGSVNEDNNAVIPNTIQSSLNSQAVIDEGQSVLIAGYTRNQKQTLESKVPILGDIPLLGWFFKNESTVNHKITTLYLVTPKVIGQDDMKKITSYVMVGGNKIDDVKPEYQPGATK